MMDLTPLEVRKKKGDFRRQIRGYDPATVDDFLDLVADRLEQVVRDNLSLAEKAERLEQQVREYREREKALTEALVSAQQMREAMRVQAAHDADLARSEAAREAEQERTQAAQEADSTRRQARETLERAREEAAHQMEMARSGAESESRRILAELHRVRQQETAAIESLQAHRVQLIESYRALLERETAELEEIRHRLESEHIEVEPVEELHSIPETVLVPAAVPVEPEAAPVGEGAAHAEAPSELDEVWLDEFEPLDEIAGSADVGGDEILLDGGAQPVASEQELVLMDVEDDDTWLASLAADAPPAAQVAGAVDQAPSTPAESDEEFIDSLLAEAGVTPLMEGGAPPDQPFAEHGVTESVEGGETILELNAEDLIEVDELPPALGSAESEGGFDALFDDGDQDLADFDFDAALANATGVSSQPNRVPPTSPKGYENVLDLGAELNGAPSPRDLGRRSQGAFDNGDLGLSPNMPSLSRSPGGHSDLTLRPLSPEEEAPDVPAPGRRPEDDGDDMFATMFGGR